MKNHGNLKKVIVSVRMNEDTYGRILRLVEKKGSEYLTTAGAARGALLIGLGELEKRVEQCLKPPTDAKLYDFEGETPPWTSYCRACFRRAGMDPYKQKMCEDATTCDHYPFKWLYKPKDG